MIILSAEKIALFLREIKKLRRLLETLRSENPLQSFERFENQLTIDELEACFSDPTSEAFNAKLIHLLSMRWERIRNSSMCYTQKPMNTVNQLCLELAKAISPPVTTKSEIEALEPNVGPYHLLMPSIEESVDIYGENIHSLDLHMFILSDNERVYIPLAQCLYQASISEEGQLKHMVKIDGEYPILTRNEVERVSYHSKQASEFYLAIIALNKQRLLSDDIGAKLSQLARQLRSGGAKGSGSELNAGSAANLGILAFGEYWEALPERQKLAIFTETPGLRNILGRLFRPVDAHYQETRFCVELLAGELDSIILAYNDKPNIQKLQRIVSSKEKAFKTEVMNNRAIVTTQNANPPKHILHHLFKLDMREQCVLFEKVGCENALMYALAHAPETLLEFELNESSKQTAISARVNINDDTALILAAKHGKADVVTLLLNWGAQIELHDVNESTALHWAANNGHVEAVNHLLDNGSLLEAKGDRNNTALNFAVMHGKSAVVELLLQKNASVNARNIRWENALDIAIATHPEFIEPLLMQIATLPMDKQAECLLNVSEGIYPNALFYAAAKKPALFDVLMDRVLQEPNPTLKIAFLNSSNQQGCTPFILAAQVGAHESIRKLLAYGIEIESHDVNESTALHWAANNGHIEAVNHLLDNGALLEAKGYRNNTGLNFAVMHGKGAVVELLLQKNASVNARNNRRENALDIAIATHPEFIEPLLMQIATLPMDKQAECLLNVSEGIYNNVFTYAAIKKPHLLERLFTLNISQQPKKDTSDITNILSTMHFDEHLQCISTHYQLMKNKSQDNSNYIAATSAAKTLLIECIEAKATLFHSDGPIDNKILTFQKTCKGAIETAKPVLKKYREWGKVLWAFLLAIITLPVSLPLYAIGFFSVKTKSEQLLDKFHEAIGQPNSRGG